MRIYQSQSPLDHRIILEHSRGTQMLVNTSDWGVTKEQFVKDMKGWAKSKLIQNALHYTPVEVREFIITGLTPTEQKRMYNKNVSN